MKEERTHYVFWCISRFFIDNQPDTEVGSIEPTAADKARISQRINRFGRQGASEGNKHAKKKVSIDDMLKTVVSGLLMCLWLGGLIPMLIHFCAYIIYIIYM